MQYSAVRIRINSTYVYKLRAINISAQGVDLVRIEGSLISGKEQIMNNC